MEILSLEHMLASMAEKPVAAAAGLFAMVCLATWPLFRTRQAMLGTYICNNLGFFVHYALLGHWTAVLMNAIMSAQTLVAIGLERRPQLRWVYYALMPVLALACIVTWRGFPSFLSTTATTLSTLGRMQRNERILRILVLASTPFWAAHDLTIGSLPGVIADVLSNRGDYAGAPLAPNMDCCKAPDLSSNLPNWSRPMAQARR
jgi:hypothetical protein